MKKTFIAGSVACALAVGAFFVVADPFGEEGSTAAARTSAKETAPRYFGPEKEQVLEDIAQGGLGAAAKEGVGVFINFEGGHVHDTVLKGANPALDEIKSGTLNGTVSRIQNFDDRPYCFYKNRDFSGSPVIDLQPGVTIKFTGPYAQFNDNVLSMKPC
ncbi:hypothetical protein ACH4C6_34750 [Streptomyces sp. NPDC017943]|uniref:hypothetical protein n=1 Tax=Streptomyces TaxID=1883 RepID=UPI0034558C61